MATKGKRFLILTRKGTFIMQIRKAGLEDLTQILRIYERARQFMRETGNPNQWKESYPPKALTEQGILDGKLYVCVADGPQDGAEEEAVRAGELLGVFYFAREEEASYREIREGSWQNSEPYAVIHRVAGSGRGKGFSRACFDWATAQCPNIKIYTHRDNRVMQHVLEKNGFRYCGRITLADGTERLAYQRCSREYR